MWGIGEDPYLSFSRKLRCSSANAILRFLHYYFNCSMCNRQSQFSQIKGLEVHFGLVLYRQRIFMWLLRWKKKECKHRKKVPEEDPFSKYQETWISAEYMFPLKTNTENSFVTGLPLKGFDVGFFFLSAFFFLEYDCSAQTNPTNTRNQKHRPDFIRRFQNIFKFFFFFFGCKLIFYSVTTAGTDQTHLFF